MARSPARIAPAPARDGDWTVQAADTVERVVTGIRGRTTVPLTTIARAVVYGLVVATMAVVVLVLVAVVAVRLGASYVPLHDPPGRAVWVTEAGLGGIFTILGLFVLRQANATRASAG